MGMMVWLKEMGKVFSLCFSILILSVFFTALPAESMIDAGKKTFEKYCAVCHGAKGDAQGQVCFIRSMEKSGRVMNTYPRDFTVGVFKFRTTSTGCLPTDDDLMKIATEGIPKSSMPSFKDMPMEQRKAVIGHIKTFSKRWKEEEACKPFVMKRPKWLGSAESIEKGKKVYKDMKCWECHGEEGKGDGQKSDKLKDDWGRPIVPFDFTTGQLKRGTSPENIYITYTTGLDGTGMPSYEDSLNEEGRWHLVSYTLKLMKIGK